MNIEDRLIAMSKSDYVFADRTQGMCHEIKVKHGKAALNKIYKYVKLWPGHSGDKDCPVPHPRTSARFAHDEIDLKWGNSQYALNRRALCYFLGNYMKDMKLSRVIRGRIEHDEMMCDVREMLEAA